MPTGTGSDGVRPVCTRYNGGSHWQDDKVQAYGHGFDRNLDEARSALK